MGSVWRARHRTLGRSFAIKFLKTTILGGESLEQRFLGEARMAASIQHRFVVDIPLAPEHPSWNELHAIEQALPRFADCPVHLVWGARDWVFTTRFRDEWQRRFPRASCTTFEDAGHYLFEDRAEDYAAELARAVGS